MRRARTERGGSTPAGRRSRGGRAIREERGFTLIELLVTMMTALIVGAAGVTFLVVVFNQQNGVSSRNVAKNRAEAGLQQLILDLRQAELGPSAAAPYPSMSTSGGYATVTFYIPTPGTNGQGQVPTQTLVTWTCAAASLTCSRTLGSGLTATTKLELTGVESLTVTPCSLSGSCSTSLLPLTGTTGISAANVALTVQDSSYGLTALDGAATQSVRGGAAITLTESADMENLA
jgi:type II secretory pathway pseudopilin PulG